MNQYFYSLGKKLVHKISDFNYELNQKSDAKKRLKNVELVNGKTNPKFIKLSEEYAKDVLGWRGYAYWLYVYSAMSGTFKEGWIPDNYYFKVVEPSIKGDYAKVASLKGFTNKLLNSNAFPDIVYYVNQLYYSPDYKIIRENNIKDVLFKNTDVVVFKLDNSLQGRDIYFFNKTSFDLKSIKLLGNGVFQSYIEQHPFFSEFMPNSVATLRITTVLDNDNNASVRASFLRIGRKKDTHVNATTDIIIAVDIQSGVLDKYGYIDHWKVIDKHPDTDILFENKRIPNFNKCISTALELQKRMPFVRCIGWDMVIDKNDEVKIMEWNGSHNDIKFCEAKQGPCFKDLGWENLWRKDK